MDYEKSIESKTQWGSLGGFDSFSDMPFLYDFQAHLVRWSLNLGRSAIFADCGMGKTAMQLAWAQHVIEHTVKPVLIVTPLAVGAQTIEEAGRFGLTAKRSRDGTTDGTVCIWVTNYEQLHKFDQSLFSGVACDERHQHPLQLDVIARAVQMWTNPGDVVLTPFMGVGSEVYAPVIQGRRGVGCELKTSYYRQAVKNLAAACQPKKADPQKTMFEMEDELEEATR